MRRSRALGFYFGMFTIGGVIGAYAYSALVGNANSIPGLVASIMFGLSFVLILSSFLSFDVRSKFKLPSSMDVVKILLGIFVLSIGLTITRLLVPPWSTYLIFASLLALGIYLIAFGPIIASRRFLK